MTPILGIWASQGRVAGTSFESIATVTVGAGGSSTVEFTSIPSTYTHLQIRQITSNTTDGDIYMQFNNDTGSNYTRHFLYGNGTNAVAGNDLSTQSGGYTTTTSGNFGGQIIDILDYANTNKYKTSRMLTGFDNNGSGFIVLYSGSWRNTAAVSSIKLLVTSGNFRQYSSFALYGIKGA